MDTSAAPMHESPSWTFDTTARTAVLLDGEAAEFREITAADAPAIRDFYAALSPEAFYLRFFSNSPCSVDQDLVRLLRKAPGSHEALVATIEGEIVAVGCYEGLDDPKRAELAIAVDDLHHGIGVGKALIGHLATVAIARGIQTFVVETLRVNDPMVEVVRHLGMTVHMTEWDRGALQFQLALRSLQDA